VKTALDPDRLAMLRQGRRNTVISTNAATARTAVARLTAVRIKAPR
jgi:hypothetical protein